LDAVDILQGTSDELLKACNIKAGQIVRIRKSISGFASVTPPETDLKPAEPSNSDGNVFLHVVSDFSEMQQVSFNAEIVPEVTEITISSNGNDESAKLQSNDISPPVAFTTEVVTPNEKWLSSFELPIKAPYINNLSKSVFPQKSAGAIQ
ncbi:Hypothetical predicted protein, partial [Paramuricea clavata]